MDHKQVQQWLDKYIEAWRTYEPEQIRDLFSEDAVYFHSPWDEDSYSRGREAIVADWLKQPDAAGSWEARYAPVAVEGNIAVAQGRSIYNLPEGIRKFDNIFVLHFDDKGRCSRFTEWYMEPRKPG